METKLGLRVALVPQALSLEAQEAFALPIKVLVHNSADSIATILRCGPPFGSSSWCSWCLRGL
ncbi:hypothetical protein PITC_043940 [Penicillium italicum]|uniref:Uncharacterized protein n=1 Tax=Penicillium italicum TaxID=40296 RepID=A0A0A2L6R1_PENIT|nr:hypothetical protein PITC_043940 [Penicillium italicum]